MKRLAIFSLLVVGVTSMLAAMNTSIFVNLGFSPDSSAFAFAFHGIVNDKNTAHAELYVIDVQKNKFFGNGQFEFTSTEKVEAGQDGSGCLYTLIGRALPTLTKAKIDHTLTGRVIYLLVDNEKQKNNLAFTDFNTGTQYTVTLHQVLNRDPETKTKSAAFSIATTRQTADGLIGNYTVGDSDYFRDNVTNYKIRQIILSPNQASLVFVIEMDSAPGAAFASTYMVETVALD